MTGYCDDFPDRDEWTDKLFELRRDTGECDVCYRTGFLHRVEAYGIETYACEDCRGVAKTRLAAEAEQAMEDAEWDALGETDLLSADELADLGRIKPTDLSNNQFSDA